MVQTVSSLVLSSLLVSALLLTLALAAEDKRGAQTKATVVYQSFDWNDLSNRGALYPTISSLAPSLSQAGITHVWFPPPSQSADQQGYMPGEWYNILSSGALKSAIGAVKGAGMQAVCDIVINHRTATYKSPCDSNWNNFTQPNWGTWAVVKNDYMCNSGSTFCQGSCSCGNADTGQNFCGAPDVDHTNSQVQKDVGSWLGWLKSEYGFSGWRFDMVVGYAGQYVGQYIAGSSPQFSVGEYWDDDTSHVTQWIASTGYRSTAFDFPNRDTLKAAVDSNDFTSLLQGISPPGVMGQMPLYSSTFTDNHDTARTDRFGSPAQITMGYAYILSHPGTPFVFADDWATPQVQTAIKTFLALRNQQGLSPSSSLYVDQHTKGLYSVYLGGANALCTGNTALKLGTSSWSPCGNNWKLYTSGSNYALWVR